MEKEKSLKENDVTPMEEDENFDLSMTDNLIEYSNPNSNASMDIIEEDDGIDNDKENPNEVDETSSKPELPIVQQNTKSAITTKLSAAKLIVSTANSNATSKQTTMMANTETKSTLSGSLKPVGQFVHGISKIPANVTKTGGGQIVIIQTPSGAKQSIRLAGNATQGTSIGSGQGYQIIKTAEGNIIQIRNDKNSSRLSNASQNSQLKKVIVPQKVQNAVTGKFIYKGITVRGNEQQIMLSTPPSKSGQIAVASTSSNINPTTVTSKAITLSEAQQMGIFSSGKIKQIMLTQKGKQLAIQSSIGKNIKSITSIPQPPLSPNAPTAQVLTNAIKKLAPIQPKMNMPMIKAGGNQVKKMIPSGMIKVASSSGNAINIGGKGVQYVRFVPVTSSSTSSSTTTTMAGKLLTGTKLISSATPGGQATVQGQKILIQGKSVALIQSNTSGQPKIVHLSQQMTKPPGAKLIQTIAMPRKILPLSKLPTNASGDSMTGQKLIAVVKKEDNASSDGKTPKVTTITPSQLSQLQGTSIIPGNNKSPPIVMLPSNFIQQLQQKHVEKKKDTPTFNVFKIKKEIDLKIDVDTIKDKTDKIAKPINNNLDGSANRKKPCNCTRSQCLKLYCDCFANGEFCSNCNCRECFNNLTNEEERQKAIRICLERNPNAFRPKIGKAKDKDQSLRHHTKGCNCKRSGCLKNYCECYEAKISCSQNCKCIGCRNNDEFFERSTNDFTVGADLPPAPCKVKYPSEGDKTGEPPSKQPYNFMTPDVIDATVQCMIAQAEECQRKNLSSKTAEKLILEEFGRCIVEIIDFSINNTENTEND